jgi:hypothetical protein
LHSDNLGGSDWDGTPDPKRIGDWRNFKHTFKPWTGELYHMVDAWGWRPPELEKAGEGAAAVNDRACSRRTALSRLFCVPPAAG